MSRVFKAAEAAEYIGAHVETVRRLARRGQIPSFKVGKDWRFNESELQDWQKAQQGSSGIVHVMAVDDDAGVLTTFRHILDDEKYRLSTFTSGAHALRVMVGDMPDVILLDLKMPGMSGPETLCEIRKLDKTMPVVIITGYPDSDLMLKAMEYSPIMVLHKPVKPKQVIDSVDMAINGTRKKRGAM